MITCNFITPGNPAYNRAKPKQFGTTHERMKHLLTVMAEYGGDGIFPSDLAWAIFDLETAVKFNPPGRKPA